MTARKWVAVPVLIVLAVLVFLVLQCETGFERPPVMEEPEEIVPPDVTPERGEERSERPERERASPDGTAESADEGDTEAVEDVGPEPPALLDITVTVLADESGSPLPDARVEVQAEGLDWRREGRTDAEGRIGFSGVPPEELLSIRAFADGRIRAERSVPANDAELRLVAGRMIEGRVLRDTDGSPVADAEVLLAPGGSVDGMSSATSEGLLGRTRTDASGRFRIGAAEPGEIVTVVASTSDLVPAAVGLIVPATDAAPSPVELRLGPAGRIVGIVTGVDGEPLGGARVYGAGLEHVWILDSPESSHSGSAGVRQALAANTGDDGRYELTGVPLDRPYAVVAVDSLGRRSEIAAGFVVTEGTPTAQANLAVLERATVVVRLVPPPGDEVGEHVEAQLWGASWPKTGRLMDDGRHHFSAVPAGSYSIQVTAKGFVKHVEQLELTAGELREMEIELQRGLEVHGTVVDDEGRPIPDFSVSVGRPYGPDHRELAPSEAGTSTDEDGRFTLSGLRSGPHRLAAYGVAHESVEIEAFEVPTAPLELVARREGSIVGRVVLPEGAAEPEELTVQIEDEAGGGFGSGGSFDPEIDQSGIPLGRVVVRILATGYSRWERTIQVEPGRRVDLGQIELDVGVSVSGRVVGADSRPLAGVTIEHGDAFSPEYQVVTTDAGGRFSLRNLPTGAVQIQVRATDHLSGSHTLDPTDPETLELRLERGSVVRGKALDPNGAPVVGGWVQAARVDGDDDLSEYADTDGAGEFRMRVRAGAYVFTWGDGERELGPSEQRSFQEGSTEVVELR